MLPRVLEPEVMDTPEEAAEYDAMDHSEVNARFAADALAARGVGQGGRWLDLGTGTAQIPIEIGRADPSLRIVAVDLSRHMLDLARQNVQEAGLADRIELREVDAKGTPYPDGSFDCVVSNSIAHHVPNPLQFAREAVRLIAPGGTLFLRDLIRPDSTEAVEALVARYVGDETERARGLFRDSLHAGLTLDEVRALARSLGLPDGDVSASSDRHWTWSWNRPAAGSSR